MSIFGLGAISAAVMSSADSSVLSASSMFARNVWKSVFRQKVRHFGLEPTKPSYVYELNSFLFKKASETEILWVMRVGIFLVTLLATIMGITIKSVYGLWFLCSDLVYVVLFPQLCCVIYYKKSNTYGSLVAYIVGIALRLSAGESMFGLSPLIEFPGYDAKTDVQKFPFRTLSMLTSFFFIITISILTNFIFENDYLHKRWDIFQCITNIPTDTIALNQSLTIDEMTRINNGTIRYDQSQDVINESLINTAISVNPKEKNELEENSFK